MQLQLQELWWSNDQEEQQMINQLEQKVISLENSLNELNREYSQVRDGNEPWNFKAEFECADFFKEKVEAFVSPANSFDWMDDGIDLYICQKIEHFKKI